MAIGWTILLAGVGVAHSFRSLPGSLWFQLHRGMQLLGLACVLTAFILTFSALGGHRTRYTLHFNLGVAATTLALAQLSALVFRPHLDSRWRRLWALSHHWIGRSAVALGVANVFYGLINVRHVGAWPVITFSVVIGLVAGAAILKDSVVYLRMPPPAALDQGESGSSGSGSRTKAAWGQDAPQEAGKAPSSGARY